MISGKVIVFADEAFWAGDKREIGALKRIITEPTLRITRKGIDSTEEQNCMHLFMATNEQWSVPAQFRERRFFALKVSDAHIQDLPYFQLIEDELEHGGAAAFLAMMLARPVSPQEIRAVPKTDELLTQKRLSETDDLTWWEECLERFEIPNMVSEGQWRDPNPIARDVASSAAHKAYLSWCTETNAKTTVSKQTFVTRMEKFLYEPLPANVQSRISRSTGKQVRMRILRTLDEATAVFEDAR